MEILQKYNGNRIIACRLEASCYNAPSMKESSYILAVAAVTAALVVPVTARADIYGFTDEKGVKHFTNIAGLDRRYKLVRKEGPIAPRAATTRAR